MIQGTGSVFGIHNARPTLLQPKVKLNTMSQLLADHEEQELGYNFITKAKETRLKEVSEFLKIHAMSAEQYYVDFSAMVSDLLGQIDYDHDEKFVIAEAINLFFSIAVDPHTYIIPTAMLEEMNKSSNGAEFVGIGSAVYFIDGEIVLIPMENSPAAKSNVLAGDVLTQIDGASVNGNVQMAFEKLPGPIGSEVQLTLLRDGAEKKVVVIREPIEIKNVQSKVLTLNGASFGYVQLSHFMSELGCDELSDAITSLEKKNVKGLILDLRGNGGGQVDQAKCVAGLFLGKGVHFVTFKEVDGYRSEKEYTSRHKITDLPMVTLINGESASAAEMLAGSLQFYGRSWILGERSFGKGSRQSGAEVLSGVHFMQTVDLFYMPNDWTSQAVGVTPDFSVPFFLGMTEEERFVMRESDLFMNVIDDHKEKIVWQEPRPADVLRIKTCMETSGHADHLFGERKKNPENSDYQLLSAQDVLACEFK